MTTAGSPLRRRLLGGERAVGALVRMPAEDDVEMLAVAGFDFAVVDCEHGPADVLALRHHIALGELHAMAVLVRIGADERALALRALDQGAQGIIAPHIDTPEQAAALVRAVHYPPQGARSFATYPRSGQFGSVGTELHRQHALDSTLVLGMIESPRAVANAAAILQTRGIDGYLIGIADLQASSRPDDPPLVDAMASVRRHGRATEAIRADLAVDAQSARTSLADGAQMIVYNLTHAVMSLLRELRL